MSSVSAVVLAAVALYGLLLAADAVLKSCKSYSYVMFLHRAGFELKLFQIKWTTQSLNRLFTRLGTWRPAVMGVWFSVGAYLSSLLLVPAMVLLVRTLVFALMPATARADADDRIVLQPVLPGVNMPLEDLGYYFVTLLVCSVIHEAGHALAAVHEDVRVLSFGGLVFFAL